MPETDRDMTVWLAAQLAQPWTAERVSSALTSDVLKQVESKWSMIEPPVKLRVMLALVSSKRGTGKAANWDSIESLLNVAGQDQDEWVSVIANIVKTVTRNGSTPAIQHAQFKSMCTDVAEKLSKVPSAAMRDLPPLESLYISGEGDGDDPSMGQREHAHFKERTPFKAEGFGLGTISVEAAMADEEAQAPKRQPDSGPTRIFSKAITPRDRDSTWGSSGPNLADYARQERKVVVEEADEEDLGDDVETNQPSKRKRSALMPAKREKHADGEGGRAKKAKGAAHAAAAARHEADEDSEEEANSGPAPFSEAGADAAYEAPPYSYGNPEDQGGYAGGAGGSMDEEEQEIQPPPQPPQRVEGMEEWKKKLTSVAGLIELVQTSALGMGEQTAIVDFIQGKKQNPFGDGQEERTYVIREEKTSSGSTTINFTMSYVSGQWKVS